MWIWIVILIVLVVIVYFLFSRDKELNELDANGGIRKKYAVLINGLMVFPEMEVKELKRDYITIATDSGGIGFTILHSFDKVTVVLKTRIPISSVRTKWEFNNNKDQTEIAEQILGDLATAFNAWEG